MSHAKILLQKAHSKFQIDSLIQYFLAPKIYLLVIFGQRPQKLTYCSTSGRKTLGADMMTEWNLKLRDFGHRVNKN